MRCSLGPYRLFLVFGICLVVSLLRAQGQARKGAVPTASEGDLPYNQQPINYSERQPEDAISRLQQQLQSGVVSIQRGGENGTLARLLKALDVPISSQLLVFSKSSANARLITPRTPRAIYFNDDVYVGWVPGSSMIEISAIDADAGGMFYRLDEPQASALPLPPISHRDFHRDESCLLCHITRSTLRVPGHLVRSFTTDFEGQLRTGWSRVTHATPYFDRWAGWYVTGSPTNISHLGNVFGDKTEASSSSTEVTDLSRFLDKSKYLASSSDIVPHLVLDHQAHGHNLIARLNYEARLGRPITAAEPLLRYLLFLDEPQLPAAVTLNSEYRTWFEGRSPRDSQGRSLRQFDLKTRLFRFRMSYLIYSPAFDALPATIRTEFYKNLKVWLTAADPENPATNIPLDERQAILEILRETKTGLLDGW